MASSVGSRKRHPRPARDCRSLFSAEEADAPGASAAADAIAARVFSGGEVRYSLQRGRVLRYGLWEVWERLIESVF